MKVAEAVTRALVAEGVRVATGVAGNSIQELAEALNRAPEMRLCYARQERVAVDIADGYARVTGQPAVVFSDHGPGAANTMAGMVNSFGDSTPVLFISGQNRRFEVPAHLYKELAIHDVFRPVTKWATAIVDHSQIEQVIRRAFVLFRSGRPGPIVIELPEDVAHSEAPDFHYDGFTERLRCAGDPSSVECAVRALASAQRPYLLVGAGALFSDATDELVELAELLTLPVATTLNGKSAFPENHPLALGIGGFSRATYDTVAAVRFAQDADVVLSLGCGFKKHILTAPMPEGVTHIQVDVDASELHREARADIAVLGDVKLVLRQMIEAARSTLPASRMDPRAGVTERIAELRREFMDLSMPHLTSSDVPINPFRVTWELAQAVDPDETIVLHDAGSVRGTTCQHYIATTPRSFLGYGVESAMGWSLGAAIGAKLAVPDKLVVAVTGDEAFGETAMDLETAMTMDAPILMLLKNNRYDRSGDGGLNAVRSRRGGDYAAVARALGAHGARVEDPADLRQSLADAIACVRGGQSAVVEVMTRRVQPSLTRHLSGPALAVAGH